MSEGWGGASDKPVSFSNDDMVDRVEQFLADNPPLTNAALRSRIATLEAQLAEARKALSRIQSLADRCGDLPDTDGLRRTYRDIDTMARATLSKIGGSHDG